MRDEAKWKEREDESKKKASRAFIITVTSIQLLLIGYNYLFKPREALLVDRNKDGIEEVLIRSKIDEKIYYPINGSVGGKQIYFSGSRLERIGNEVKVYFREEPYKLKISKED